MHSSTEAFICAKLKHPAWKTLLSSTRWGDNVDKRKAPCWKFLFSYVAVNQCTLHHFLFSYSCFSAAQIPKISLLALSVASLDNYLALHARCNCQPFVFTVVWCTARQADRNGETVNHFHNCIKVLSRFRTPYCTNMRLENNRPKRGGVHDTAQIPYLQFSLPNSVPENCVGP